MKRYTNWCAATHGHEMLEHKNGGWVRYDEAMETEADLLHACEVAETVLMLVEPRSHKTEYLDSLAVVRRAIAKTKTPAAERKE